MENGWLEIKTRLNYVKLRYLHQIEAKLKNQNIRVKPKG
jgi:hypothetical protein